MSSPHLQVSENGSLNILDARDSDAGHYMCQASNGVGAGLSKVIRVTINGKYYRHTGVIPVCISSLDADSFTVCGRTFFFC